MRPVGGPIFVIKGYTSLLFVYIPTNKEDIKILSKIIISYSSSSYSTKERTS